MATEVTYYETTFCFRFGTEKFSLSDLDNHFAHLTNSSLNKLGPKYTELKERVGAGKTCFLELQGFW